MKIINFPVVHDDRGKLIALEELREIPFQIRRVYYIYDIPAESSRGGHAHIDLEQIMIAISGSFTVIVNNGILPEQSIELNTPRKGLYLPRLTWRSFKNFSSGSVCLVLASELYNEKDYINDKKEFFDQVLRRSSTV